MDIEETVDVLLDQETAGLLYDLDLMPEQCVSKRSRLTSEVIKRLHKRDKLEALAEYAHDAWAGWIEYMFEKGTLSNVGELEIPTGLTTRWNRQMQTPYDELPEEEKESDRKEARVMLNIIGGK